MALTQVQGGMLAGSSNTVTTIQSNGTTAITIDASQNVGIGTTTPATKLQISGSDTVLLSGEGNGDRSYGSTFASISKPNIALGYSTDNSTYKNFSGLGLDFTNGVFGIVSNNQYTGGGKIAFYTGDITSTTGSFGERMRINSSGQVLVGTTTAPLYGKFQAYASADNNASFVADSGFNPILVWNKGTSSQQFIEFGSGSSYVSRGSITTNGSTTAYNTNSDYRLKENIAPMTGALATVTQLKPVTYNWKLDGSSGQGFIAHELQAVVPDCVIGIKDAVENYTDEDGNEQTKIKPQGVDTSFLVATLTAAIQELNAKVDAQALEISALKATP